MLLQIDDLHIQFDGDEGESVHAVDGVSLTLDRGEILGLVGESGCGKSATAMSIPRLLPMPPARVTHGSICFDGINLIGLPLAKLRELRGARIGVIFQDPLAALSPLHKIGDQLEEVLHLHRKISAAEARAKALDWLGRVGLPDPVAIARALPHELSGGMRQRVVIAMALILEPDLVIADEPTTALDVTIQAQVLELLRKLHRQNSGILLITHDMGVIYKMATRVAVMYAGQIVETAPAADFFAKPLHPYSRALLHSMPSAATRGKPLAVIPGQVPSDGRFPAGCRFHDRCDEASAACAQTQPLLEPIGPNHSVRCLRTGKHS